MHAPRSKLPWSTLHWQTVARGGAICGIVSLASAGCAHHHRQHRRASTDPDSSETLEYRSSEPIPTTHGVETPLSSKTIDEPVAEGTLPLVYLIGADGTVRVTDLTSQQTLANSPVSHNSTVAVDSGRGVIVDGNVIASGPLSVTDHYGIYYSIHGEPAQFKSQSETNDPGILREKTKVPSTPSNPFGNSPATQPTTAPEGTQRNITSLP